MMEWADRVNQAQIERIFALGEYLTKIPEEYKPMKMTLLAMKLKDEGIARSEEEALVMLMEAYAWAEVQKIMDYYDGVLEKLELYITKRITKANKNITKAESGHA